MSNQLRKVEHGRDAKSEFVYSNVGVMATVEGVDACQMDVDESAVSATETIMATTMETTMETTDLADTDLVPSTHNSSTKFFHT